MLSAPIEPRHALPLRTRLPERYGPAAQKPSPLSNCGSILSGGRRLGWAWLWPYQPPEVEGRFRWRVECRRPSTALRGPPSTARIGAPAGRRSSVRRCAPLRMPALFVCAAAHTPFLAALSAEGGP